MKNYTFDINLKDLKKDVSLQLALIYSASDWWRKSRPISFSILEHIQNPTVNLSRGDEDCLATYTSMFIAKHGFNVCYKRTKPTKLWRKYVPVWKRHK